MKRFILFSSLLIVILLCGCDSKSVSDDIYDKVEPNVQFEYLSKQGIPADDVVEDARVYLTKANSFIGLNLSIDDINKILEANGYPASEPIVMHAGEVMKGWWNDGISTTNIDGKIYIHFDKAGNVYEIAVEDDDLHTTSRGIGIGSTVEEFKSIYGEPEMVTIYTEGPEIFNYYFDKFYIRFLVIEGEVVSFKISETVSEYVLYEFQQ